ncbi:MAG: hypothetical protein ACOYL6_18130 [Bacteriovoracaceae bacterium]
MKLILFIFSSFLFFSAPLQAEFHFCDIEFAKKVDEASLGKIDDAYFQAYGLYFRRQMAEKALARGYIHSEASLHTSTLMHFELRYRKAPSSNGAEVFQWRLEADLSNEEFFRYEVFNQQTNAKVFIEVPKDQLLSQANQYFAKTNIQYGFKKIANEKLPTNKDINDYLQVQKMASESYGLLSDQLSSLVINDLLQGKLTLEMKQVMAHDLNKLKLLSQYMRKKEGSHPELHLTFDGPLSLRTKGYDQNLYGEIKPVRVIKEKGVAALLFNLDFLQLGEKINSSMAFHTFYQFVHENLKLKELSQSYAYSLSFIEAGKSINLHYLDVNLMKTYQKEMNASSSSLNHRFPFAGTGPSTQFLNLPEASRRYIAKAYQQRLNIAPDDLENLIKISEELENRTTIIVSTKESYAQLDWQVVQKYDEGFQINQTYDKINTSDFEQFNILGSISLVESSSVAEKLPLEIFTGYQVERPTEGVVLEIGRFSVDFRERAIFTEELMNAAFLKASHTPNVSKIVIEMEKNLAERLVLKYGFQKVHERTNFEGKTEYILEVTPEVLFKNTFTK